MKRFIAATALVAVLGVGGSTVIDAAAFAHSSPGDHNSVRDVQFADAQTQGDHFRRTFDRHHAADPNAEFKAADFAGNTTNHHRRHGFVLGRHWLINAAADAIGMDPADLRQQLHQGMSIAGVAVAKGVDPSTVVNTLVTVLSARIDRAVANGKVSADKAASIKSMLTERITMVVNATSTKRLSPTTTSTTG